MTERAIGMEAYARPDTLVARVAELNARFDIDPWDSTLLRGGIWLGRLSGGLAPDQKLPATWTRSSPPRPTLPEILL